MLTNTESPETKKKKKKKVSWLVGSIFVGFLANEMLPFLEERFFKGVYHLESVIQNER